MAACNGFIALAIRDVEHAGGKILRQGEFVSGEPYLFAADPDGDEIEIWYEIPTPVDPPDATTNQAIRL